MQGHFGHVGVRLPGALAFAQDAHGLSSRFSTYFEMVMNQDKHGYQYFGTLHENCPINRGLNRKPSAIPVLQGQNICL